jgi:hypothetical protein
MTPCCNYHLLQHCLALPLPHAHDLVNHDFILKIKNVLVLDQLTHPQVQVECCDVVLWALADNGQHTVHEDAAVAQYMALIIKPFLRCL